MGKVGINMSLLRGWFRRVGVVPVELVTKVHLLHKMYPDILIH